MTGFETYDLHEQEYGSFEELRENFEWYLPETFNAGQFLCRRWVEDGDGDREALIYEDETSGESGSLTYEELDTLSNRVANYLADVGVSAGDRVAVNLPQKRETLITHLGAWKLGAVSEPLSVLYGPDALEYRIDDSDPVAGIVDASNVEDYRSSIEGTTIEQTLVVGDVPLRDDEFEYWETVSSYDGDVTIHETDIGDPMLLMYSSGTTGPPKGILQSHRSVLGHLPGVMCSFLNCEVNDDDVIWTPSEWAWGASLSVMFTAMAWGLPIVAYETGESFDPERAADLIRRHDVTAPFVPPSAIRMMMQSDAVSGTDFPSVRVVSSGGESLTAEARTWAEQTFDAAIHEIYGLTEIFNIIVGDCAAYKPTRAGWMGYALPGHRVEILDRETSEPIGTGEVGEIGVHRDDPTIFTEYWNQPEKTAATFSGEWMLTGDLAERDEEGCFNFYGRKDDLIISSGYRIGPEEVEDSLLTHDAVADAGVVGVPHESRGQVPKAYIVPEDSVEKSDDLVDDIQTYVRENLAAYEYPREVEFIDELPRTTTGKIQRARLRDREPDDR